MFQRFMENITDAIYFPRETGRAVALPQDYVRTENRFSANRRVILFFPKTKKFSRRMIKIFKTRKPSRLYLPDRQLHKYDNTDCTIVMSTL